MDNMRALNETEQADYLAGHKVFPGAVETEEGVVVMIMHHFEEPQFVVPCDPDPMHCTVEEHLHYDENDQPMTCNDCGLPCHYDEDIEDYVHDMIEAECFLIAPKVPYESEPLLHTNMWDHRKEST